MMAIFNKVLRGSKLMFDRCLEEINRGGVYNKI